MVKSTWLTKICLPFMSMLSGPSLTRTRFLCFNLFWWRALVLACSYKEIKRCTFLVTCDLCENWDAEKHVMQNICMHGGNPSKFDWKGNPLCAFMLNSCLVLPAIRESILVAQLRRICECASISGNLTLWHAWHPMSLHSWSSLHPFWLGDTSSQVVWAAAADPAAIGPKSSALWEATDIIHQTCQIRIHVLINDPKQCFKLAAIFSNFKSNLLFEASVLLSVALASHNRLWEVWYQCEPPHI